CAHNGELALARAKYAAQLWGIVPVGFHLRIGEGMDWRPFPAAGGNPGAVLQALVQLARAERWPTVEPEQG
ncbi:heme iron utilization protein, partial [Pseudomonas aeruginosa]